MPAKKTLQQRRKSAKRASVPIKSPCKCGGCICDKISSPLPPLLPKPPPVRVSKPVSVLKPLNSKVKFDTPIMAKTPQHPKPVSVLKPVNAQIKLEALESMKSPTPVLPVHLHHIPVGNIENYDYNSDLDDESKIYV